MESELKKLRAQQNRKETPKDDDELEFEPGRRGIWVTPDDPNISPWHASVLAARQQNLTRADFWKAKPHPHRNPTLTVA